MNDDKRKPSYNDAITENVLQLIDGQVGETETDEPHTETDYNATAAAIINEVLESVLIDIEADTDHSQDDDRLHRIIQMLDRCTRNLEVIEKNNSIELPATRRCQQSTQTLAQIPIQLPLPLPLPAVGSLNGQSIAPQQQQQQQLPPCERRQHIINIRTSNSRAADRPAAPHTIWGLIGRVLSDFGGALCLCLRINKDCMFCLGFFIAFVISASFLTAFFYRTINLTSGSLRLANAKPHATVATPPQGMVTLRFNGDYYYIYNSPPHHIV